MTWTKFWDMHSGGGLKEPPYDKIYIEAEQAVAERVFYTRFGHNPHRVTCTCCGSDYSIDDGESLKQMTAYHRNCRYDDVQKKWVEERDPNLSKYSDDPAWRPYLTVDEYAKQENVLVITADEITDEERNSPSPPEEGYAWV